MRLLSLGELRQDAADVLLLPHNPEHTMFLAVTDRELGLLILGLSSLDTLLPEMRKPLQRLAQKVKDVSKEQGFLNWDCDE